jgi:putative ATP-dependent endonuclease of OLD family
MYISKVSIRNYRNFKNSFFVFDKGINTIIGENGSGKTNVFRAIRLILDDYYFRYAYKLKENDFCRGIDDWRGHWIIISLEFSEISTDEAVQALFIHGTGSFDSQNSVTRATYNLFFRPKPNIRKKLSELEFGQKDELREMLSGITIDDYETVFTGKSMADFNDDEVYKDLVGDFENVKFKFDIDESKYGIKIPHQMCISKEVSFTFIKALRDVVSDFQNHKANPLITLLKIKAEQLSENEFKPVSEKVRELNSSIEALQSVGEIRKDIKKTIDQTVGDTYSPSSLSIKSELSDEAPKLFQSLGLFIAEPSEIYEGGVHELSLGGANLIYLTLKLLEYEYQKAKETIANFLLIEEPEAHIHTHIQKTIFSKLNFEDTQIIYSTHSTHISEVSRISNMNVLAKVRNYAEVYQPSTGLETNEVVKLERYLDAVRTNLLFAKGVILVEGDAEEILIPIMVKQVLGLGLDELGISLINIRSTGFENVAQIFHKKRIRKRCSIITDLDIAIDKAGENAEKQGAERKKRLNEFSRDNDFVKTFYAEHTFEIEFIKSNNSYEATQLLPEIYAKSSTRKQAKEELNSEDVKVYGKRILTMAEQEGKGWFAVMLGKYIDHKTYIPEYIIDALVFAKGDFSRATIFEILNYRFQKLKDENEDEIYIPTLEKELSEFRCGKKEIIDIINFCETFNLSEQALGFLERIKNVVLD